MKRARQIHERRGSFRISQDLVLDNPAIVQYIMSQVIVVRAEMCWMSNSIHYDAISRHFDVCEIATIPPEYEVVIKDNGLVQFIKKAP